MQALDYSSGFAPIDQKARKNKNSPLVSFLSFSVCENYFYLIHLKRFAFPGRPDIVRRRLVLLSRSLKRVQEFARLALYLHQILPGCQEPLKQQFAALLATVLLIKFFHIF
jgi:hypothetical protein